MRKEFWGPRPKEPNALLLGLQGLGFRVQGFLHHLRAPDKVASLGICLQRGAVGCWGRDVQSRSAQEVSGEASRTQAWSCDNVETTSLDPLA